MSLNLKWSPWLSLNRNLAIFFYFTGRSAKTGGSKGYAFVEFMFKDVAKIVAETMNNYLMFEKLIKCQVVPADKVGKGIFKGKINPLKPPRKMARFAAKKALNATRTDEQNDNRSKRQAAKLKQIQAKLEEYGVQLAIPEVSCSQLFCAMIHCF